MRGAWGGGGGERALVSFCLTTSHYRADLGVAVVAVVVLTITSRTFGSAALTSLAMLLLHLPLMLLLLLLVLLFHSSLEEFKVSGFARSGASGPVSACIYCTAVYYNIIL